MSGFIQNVLCYLHVTSDTAEKHHLHDDDIRLEDKETSPLTRSQPNDGHM